MPPRALLLDFDGVIADSENHHIAAWQRTLRDLGRDASDEFCSKAAEIDDRAFLLEVLGADTDGVDLEGWLKRKEVLTAQMLAHSPRLYEGVRPLVSRVASMGIPIGIVSTTRRENIDSVLNSTGLETLISLIVAKQDVTAFKPDPEGYLKALKELGLRPEEAVAIEDSDSGFRSARSAGLRTLIVGHRRPTGPWHGDSPYLPNFRKTNEVLAAIDLNPEN